MDKNIERKKQNPGCSVFWNHGSAACGFVFCSDQHRKSQSFVWDSDAWAVCGADRRCGDDL